MIIKGKIQLSKAYSFLLRSYIITIAAALGISVFGYVYSYWMIRQDIDINYSALLNEQKLTFDKEWRSVEANISAAASNSLVKQLAQLEVWQVMDLYSVVDLISELKASLRENHIIENIGVYFYKNKSFVTDNDRYAEQINHLYLLKYNISVDEFTSGMKGVSGYFVISKAGEHYLIIYHNIFDHRYKEVIATSFAILPWSNLSEVVNPVFVSQDSGCYLINSDGIMIGNTNPKVQIHLNDDSYLQEDNNIFVKKYNGKEYILSSITSEVFDIKYTIYAPKSIFFKNIHILGYIIIAEMVLFILVGGYLSIYFSKKNSLPVERLLTMLKVQKNEVEDTSLAQIYQNLENSLQSLITGHDNLYHKLNNIDLVVEKYVFTNLMRNWRPDDGWMEEYLFRIKEKYPLSNYRVILFSFSNLNHSLFAKEQEKGNTSIDFPFMIFSIKNVINEIVLKYDYSNGNTNRDINGIVIEMGDMTACIVNSVTEQSDYALQETVQKCIDFFRSAFKINCYASISSPHKEYEELDIAYDEALMTITHKSFWGNSITDVVLYDNEKAVYGESNKENKLVFQAKKLSNCLMMKDYEKASYILDETLEKCFSKDVRKLSYNQYQASTLIFIILGNLSEMDTIDETIISNAHWTSSDCILSMGSLKDIKVSLHAIIDEIAQKCEETTYQSDEPEWLLKAEEYVKKHFTDSEINISVISDKFNISLNHLGRTFKKYRGINMLDYMHQLRIKKCKELMDQGMSVTDCAKEVGYIDAKSFIRAFKRYEGITPGQYKNNKECIIRSI